MIQKGILVWPGIDFGNNNCIRISIASCTNETIQEGIYSIISTIKD